MKKEAGDVAVRVMTECDIGFATEMTDIEKWGYVREDFQRLVYLEPDGCFVALHDNDKIGMVTTTTYGDYAFLGCLIVREQFRGQGIGEKLMIHAVEYLKTKGVRSIELDGVFPALSLYRRLGFADKYLSLRLFRPPQVFPGTVEDSKDAPSMDIILFDKRKTGIDRNRILNRYLDEFKPCLLASEKAYTFVLPRGKGRLRIAPFVAENDREAEKLLGRVLSKYSENTLMMGVPEVNRAMAAMLVRYGFKYNKPSVRMYLDKRRDYEKHVYGILSPEKG